MRLYAKDGQAFGTIADIRGDKVQVYLAGGGSFTITREQALAMKAK